MSSFFQNLSAAFASFNSSPRRPRSDDPQRPLDQHRRSSPSKQRAHSPSPRRRPPPSQIAGSRRHIKKAQNEFSLGLEDDEDHGFDLGFEPPRDIAAPQVCTSLPKLLGTPCLLEFAGLPASASCWNLLDSGIYPNPRGNRFPARRLSIWDFFSLS